MAARSDWDCQEACTGEGSLRLPVKAGGMSWEGPSANTTLSPREAEKGQAGCELCSLEELTSSLGSWRDEAEIQWGRWMEVAESRGWRTTEMAS